ncbi:hypothetical protein LRS06_05165 [Hymenobacter sp. J193]|uniref:hypothetical protein n=1 Tax=Hymenobacter sp. J193 TaxID=2898429 RepID=UPI002150DAD2|nr:hypothetical protein [Hymenobacter sp. J193]MCR5887177.1 hypothetical protein [Hymenobacter sp. J193]
MDISDEGLLEAVRTWVKLLEEERYKDAFNFTHQDPYHAWTPELMRDIIYGYGIVEMETEGERFKVTSIEEAKERNGRPYADVDFHMPRKHSIENTLIVAEIWFSLPLNGEWSDLTASFNVLYMPECVSLELQEIHVF